MTGRDLIIYILENHLEDVEIETKPLLVPLDKAAVELNGKYYIFSTEIERAKRNA